MALKGDLRWSTRIAAAFGSGMGMLLIVLGLLAFVTGNLITGIWYFLIGMFIRGAAQMSYRQVVIRSALGGEPVAHFMEKNPVTVPPSISIRELVDNYFYRYHYKMFPVSGNTPWKAASVPTRSRRFPRSNGTGNGCRMCSCPVRPTPWSRPIPMRWTR